MSRHRPVVQFALSVCALAALGVSSPAARPSKAPHNLKAPKILGKAVEGGRLTATRGKWTGHPNSFRFAWQRCSRGTRCARVAGATGSVYYVKSTDIGHRIRVVVVASNRHGRGKARSLSSKPVKHKGRGRGGVVMAFDLGWAPDSNMRWRSLDQAVLFALETTNGSALDTQLIARTNVNRWVSAAHAHGVQAFISIGGVDDQHWPTACNSTNRAQFIANLVGYARGHGFDGVDLDIEDSVFFASGPPNPAMTACVNAAANAAHTAGLQVSADVITNWGGGWWAPSASNIDQFNLMTYGDDLATLQQDVAATISQGLPRAKFVVGVDTIDAPPSHCGPYGSYAASNGMMGAFVWATSGGTSYTEGARTCLSQLASP